MAEQLNELYAEKELLENQFPGMGPKEIVEMVKSLESQLLAIVEEHFEEFVAFRAAMEKSFPGMTVEDVLECARVGKLNSHLTAKNPATAQESLEAQLIDLYEERQALATAFPGLTPKEIVEEFRAKLEKLELYYDRVA